MEREVLRFLDFELGNPTTNTFLRLESTNFLALITKLKIIILMNNFSL